jgi:hypothetical protein
VAEQGGNGVVFFQQMTSGEPGGPGIVTAGWGRLFTIDQPILAHGAAKAEQTLLANKTAFLPADIGDITVPALNQVTGRQLMFFILRIMMNSSRLEPTVP